MFCQNCGNACDDSRFCPACGTELLFPSEGKQRSTADADTGKTCHSDVPKKIPPTQKTSLLQRLNAILQSLLLLVVGAVAWWFWNQPSTRDIEQWAQKAFLEYCAENDLDVKAEDIVKTSLVSERWLKKYVGTIKLKAKDAGKPLFIFVSYLIECRKFAPGILEDSEYLGMLNIEDNSLEPLVYYANPKLLEASEGEVPEGEVSDGEASDEEDSDEEDSDEEESDGENVELNEELLRNFLLNFR